jgi:hypothetical protein
VSLDGQRFVMIKRTAATEAPRLIVVEHWFQSLPLWNQLWITRTASGRYAGGRTGPRKGHSVNQAREKAVKRSYRHGRTRIQSSADDIEALARSRPYFHNPLDMWPYTVDLDAVVNNPGAATELALTLPRSDLRSRRRRRGRGTR